MSLPVSYSLGFLKLKNSWEIKEQNPTWLIKDSFDFTLASWPNTLCHVYVCVATSRHVFDQFFLEKDFSLYDVRQLTLGRKYQQPHSEIENWISSKSPSIWITWMYLCFGIIYKQIRIIRMTPIKTQIQSKIDTAGSTEILPKTRVEAAPHFNTVYCSLRGLLSKSRLWERCCVLLGGNVV